MEFALLVQGTKSELPNEQELRCPEKNFRC